MGETLTFGFTYVPFGRRRRRQCLLADTLWGREVVVYVGFFFRLGQIYRIAAGNVLTVGTCTLHVGSVPCGYPCRRLRFISVNFV